MLDTPPLLDPWEHALGVLAPHRPSARLADPRSPMRELDAPDLAPEPDERS